MKQINHKFNQLTLLLGASAVLGLSSAAFAMEGGSHAGNGGDPVVLRTKLIKEYISTELRGDAIAYMRNLSPEQILDASARAAVQDMIARDVATDIQKSKYAIKDSCQDVGGQAGGGALDNDQGGPICLSAKRLAEIDATKAEIVGLVIHEHAHHFGYTDKNYEIFKAVHGSVSLSEPAWNTPGGAGSDCAAQFKKPSIPGFPGTDRDQFKVEPILHSYSCGGFPSFRVRNLANITTDFYIQVLVDGKEVPFISELIHPVATPSVCEAGMIGPITQEEFRILRPIYAGQTYQVVVRPKIAGEEGFAREWRILVICSDARN